MWRIALGAAALLGLLALQTQMAAIAFFLVMLTLFVSVVFRSTK